jgi:hypothetical protein
MVAMASCSSSTTQESADTATEVALEERSLTKLWSSDTTLRVPESVYFDAEGQILYVSQIDGGPAEADSKGGIAKVGLDGTIVDANWISGLHAPKGLGKFGSKLYIADITEVVIADIATGKVIQKLKAPGSTFLNDVTVDANGIVYISDSSTKKVFRLKDGKVEEYFESPERPNGLLAVGENLMILDNGNLYKLDASKTLTKLAEGMEASTDGIEEVTPGEYIVSSWIGAVYYVKEDGSVQELLNTKEEKINSADIGYDPVKKIVYIPTFAKSSVVAYTLQ